MSSRRTSDLSSGARLTRVQGMTIFVGSDTRPDDVEPWIRQFCERVEPRWYVPVDREWAVDWFNTYGLKDFIPDFELALDVIGDRRSDEWRTLSDEKVANVVIQAGHLYGLIHARWICQNRGLNQMQKKYERAEFGRCPRVHCENQALLPMGTTNRPKRHCAKLFCPKCCDIYVPQSEVKVDGAHFGPAFPHIFLSEFPSYANARKEFKPFHRKAFGFKISRNSLNRFLPHERNDYQDENPAALIQP